MTRDESRDVYQLFVGLEAVVRRLALGRSPAERGRVLTVDHPVERATGDAAALLALLDG